MVKKADGSWRQLPRYIPAATRTLKPLTDALKGASSKKAAITCLNKMHRAFQAAKEALGAATVLPHPKEGTELAIIIDASADHVSAAIQQHTGLIAMLEPLGFFSRKLDPAQTLYSAFNPLTMSYQMFCDWPALLKIVC